MNLFGYRFELAFGIDDYKKSIEVAIHLSLPQDDDWFENHWLLTWVFLIFIVTFEVRKIDTTE